MKISQIALALTVLVPGSLCFVPHQSRTHGFGLQSTAVPPERVAPDAGYIPEWTDRTGLSPEEYMASDMSKPDKSGMWECPLTLWDSKGYVLFKLWTLYILESFISNEIFYSKQNRC